MQPACEIVAISRHSFYIGPWVKWPQKRKAIIIAKYMEDSVVKSNDILLKDNLIRNLKKKLHQNQTKKKRSIPKS
jgi:hypothetical protein